jgi:hypothetical protein
MMGTARSCSLDSLCSSAREDDRARVMYRREMDFLRDGVWKSANQHSTKVLLVLALSGTLAKPFMDS